MKIRIRFSSAIASLGLALLAAGFLHSANAAAQLPNMEKLFTESGVQGTFVLLDAQTGRTLRYKPVRARTPYIPASTYKIPNSLIALETGVVSGPEFPLAWDSTAVPRQPWWPAAWGQDHTFGTALPNSVVWYYQELARRIGPVRMQKYLDSFEYGNRKMAGGIDQFWLTGELRISAEEQVDFLRRFYFEKLGVSKRSTEIVKGALVLEQTPKYRLSGKTGWAGFGDPSKPQIGWLVGYLEREGDVHFFAINIDIRNSADPATRLSITKAVLRHMGFI